LFPSDFEVDRLEGNLEQFREFFLDFDDLLRLGELSMKSFVFDFEFHQALAISGVFGRASYFDAGSGFKFALTALLDPEGDGLGVESFAAEDGGFIAGLVAAIPLLEDAEFERFAEETADGFGFDFGVGGGGEVVCGAFRNSSQPTASFRCGRLRLP